MQYAGLSVFSLFRFFIYLWGMEIPSEVLSAAADNVAEYGANFALLGELDGRAVYQFRVPAGDLTGFPFLYLRSASGAVEKVTGRAALRLLRSLDVE